MLLLLHFFTVTFQIEIKELDEFAQAAFHGYKSLNRIQSQIFQTVYFTNENILVSHWLCIYILNNIGTRDLTKLIFMHLQVCAPTGAGKTNIAMISILHEVCNLWVYQKFSALYLGSEFPFFSFLYLFFCLILDGKTHYCLGFSVGFLFTLSYVELSLLQKYRQILSSSFSLVI